MAPNLLILGGTTEASALAKAVAAAGLRAVFSYAGRTDAPRGQPIPMRVGGFGGVDGLCDYISKNDISHVVDATHPFAAQMSWNAYHACAQLKTPLIALTRPAWVATEGDEWVHVRNIEQAVGALGGAAKRVMLALGRLHVETFATQAQHHYILRLVDPPQTPLRLPNYTTVIARGPFDVAGDIALFKEHGVELVVCKNAGGKGAEAKLHAARALGLPVIMIERPALPERPEVATPDAVLNWLRTTS